MNNDEQFWQFNHRSTIMEQEELKEYDRYRQEFSQLIDDDLEAIIFDSENEIRKDAARDELDDRVISRTDKEELAELKKRIAAIPDKEFSLAIALRNSRKYYRDMAVKISRQSGLPMDTILSGRGLPSAAEVLIGRRLGYHLLNPMISLLQTFLKFEKFLG